MSCHVNAPSVASVAGSATRGQLAACSHDEFSPLTEVVVGTAAGAGIPALDRSTWLNLYPELSVDELATICCGAFPPRVLSEAEEDLDALATILRGLGVLVHRPAAVAHDRSFATPHWRSGGFYSYCPRDLVLVVGSTIIQTPSPMRARMFELAGLRALFERCMLAGSPWIAAPTPELHDTLYVLGADGRPTLAETEPVFDAANVLRCGHDLYYLVSGSGNELGRRWLQTTLAALGDYRVHPIRDVYPHTHVDSTISLIRPGLVLLNPVRVTKDALPQPLRSWEHLWCPAMKTREPVASGHPLSSEWIGMNLLMVRPDLAIVDAAQHELIAALGRRGVDVVPHTLRHARVLGGGMHCVTLDLRRDPPIDTSNAQAKESVMIGPDRRDADAYSASSGALAARYAELRNVPSARDILAARSRVVDVLRRSLHDSGHIEVDTPLLQRSRPAAGRSFRTETVSLDPHLYLRSSPLHLRAMLTTGMDRVFEIGRSFRDEPVDPTHSPEYSLVELYQANADYRTLRTVAHDLVATAARAVLDNTIVRSRAGHRIDLGADWPVMPVHQAVSSAVDHPVTPASTAEDLRDLARRRHVTIRHGADTDEILLELYDRLVEPNTLGPIVYSDFPAGRSPLAQPCAHDRRLAQKWDLVIDGREIATAYTELADAAELRRRLAPQGDRILSAEAATLDDEWLDVFAAGMPAAGGLCIGLERLLLTLTGATELREVIPFPLSMKP